MTKRGIIKTINPKFKIFDLDYNHLILLYTANIEVRIIKNRYATKIVIL